MVKNKIKNKNKQKIMEYFRFVFYRYATLDVIKLPNYYQKRIQDMFCEKTEKVTTVALTEVQPKNAGFWKFIVSKDTRLLYMGDWELAAHILQLVSYMQPITTTRRP